MKRLTTALCLAATLALGGLSTSCATSAKNDEWVKSKKRDRDPIGKLQDYSLVKRRDLDMKHLRRGQRANYSPALDSY